MQYFEQQSVENALKIFRNKWKNELQQSSKNQQKINMDIKKKDAENAEHTQEDLEATVSNFALEFLQ